MKLFIVTYFHKFQISLVSAETVTEVASYFARRTPRNDAAIARLAVLIEVSFMFLHVLHKRTINMLYPVYVYIKYL